MELKLEHIIELLHGQPFPDEIKGDLGDEMLHLAKDLAPEARDILIGVAKLVFMKDYKAFYLMTLLFDIVFKREKREVKDDQCAKTKGTT